jgi:hypothetical protein
MARKVGVDELEKMIAEQISSITASDEWGGLSDAFKGIALSHDFEVYDEEYYGHSGQLLARIRVQNNYFDVRLEENKHNKAFNLSVSMWHLYDNSQNTLLSKDIGSSDYQSVKNAMEFASKIVSAFRTSGI